MGLYDNHSESSLKVVKSINQIQFIDLFKKSELLLTIFGLMEVVILCFDFFLFINDDFLMKYSPHVYIGKIYPLIFLTLYFLVLLKRKIFISNMLILLSSLSAVLSLVTFNFQREVDELSWLWSAATIADLSFESTFAWFGVDSNLFYGGSIFTFNSIILFVIAIIIRARLVTIKN